MIFCCPEIFVTERRALPCNSHPDSGRTSVSNGGLYSCEWSNGDETEDNGKLESSGNIHRNFRHFHLHIHHDDDICSTIITMEIMTINASLEITKISKKTPSLPKVT